MLASRLRFKVEGVHIFSSTVKFKVGGFDFLARECDLRSKGSTFRFDDLI